MSLIDKLCDVMKAVERVPKRGHNDFHHYDYATEADVLAVIRQELATRRVMLIPACQRITREVLNEKGNALTTTEMTMTFIDAESKERDVFPWYGCGSDKDDKGLYKAYTGAEKYFLLKTFLIPTGDDPERDEKPDAKPTRKGVSPEPPRTVVDPATGKDVPASTRPAVAPPYHYIDLLQRPSESDQFLYLTIRRYDAQGGARTFRTKFPKLIEIATQAYQDGVAVKIDAKRMGKDYYIDKITPAKTEQQELLETVKEATAKAMADAAGEVL